MDWEQVDKVLKELINNKSDIRSGYDQIKQVLTDNDLPSLDIDTDRLKKEFNDWLIEVIKKEPIPKNIVHLFRTCKYVVSRLITVKKTTAYIAGSKLTPSEDADQFVMVNIFRTDDMFYLPNLTK